MASNSPYTSSQFNWGNNNSSYDPMAFLNKPAGPYAEFATAYPQGNNQDPLASFKASEFSDMPKTNMAFNLSGNAAGVSSAMGGRSFIDGMTGGKNADGTSFNGWGGAALGAASGLFNGFMAMKQYGMSKDMLNNNKEQFSKNFGAQRGLTNGNLQDRQDQRVREASANGRPGSVMSTADYMSKYGVA